jgi:hypothetical protein
VSRAPFRFVDSAVDLRSAALGSPPYPPISAGVSGAVKRRPAGPAAGLREAGALDGRGSPEPLDQVETRLQDELTAERRLLLGVAVSEPAAQRVHSSAA